MVNNDITGWLVVYLPLWKIWVRHWEGWHPIYETENKIHVWNHQPDYIDVNRNGTHHILTCYISPIFRDCCSCFFSAYSTPCFDLKKTCKAPFWPPKGWWITLNNSHWLVVSTPLKKVSQLAWLFPLYEKTYIPNHQPGHYTNYHLKWIAFEYR